MSEPVSRQELEAEWEGEHCNECGRGYDDVYSVADRVWALIHERAPAGLLCPTCALARLNQAILDAPPIEWCEKHQNLRVSGLNICRSSPTAIPIAESELHACQFQTYVRVKVGE